MASRHINISDPRVEEYILDIARLGGNHGLPESFATILREMESEAERVAFPITGPLLGRVLYLLAGMSGGHRIFDAGCGIGYASAWLAAGAGAGATVTCVDTDEDQLRLARRFHARTGLAAQFDYLIGDAISAMELEVGPLDMVYNDIDKGAYPAFAQLAIEKLRPGGLYIADNTLWYGKVCSGTTTRDAWTAAVDRHNQWIFAQDRLFATILDQRDGLLIAVKKQA